MKVIGVSGIEGTVDFKRRHWPGLQEREYRISQGHDSAAALVIDGEFAVGVAEERISREKHTGNFPLGAIDACLAQAGLTLSDVDEIVHSFDYAPYRALYSLEPISSELYRDVLSREAFVARVKAALGEFPAERIGHVEHHLAHAASAYFTCGWDECLVLVIDGMGEAHGATVFRAGGAPRADLPHLGGRLAGDPLLGDHPAPRLRLQLRRVQDHGPRALRRP